MSARGAILKRLRAFSKQAPTATQRDIIPAQSLRDDERVEVFIRQAKLSGAQVQRIQDTDELEARLAELRKSPHVEVVEAKAGIAESGTVCFDSTQLASLTLFLCEHLVVVLPEPALLSYPEEYWARHPATPRAVHHVTGPSRTADVEQTLQIGAHGPRYETILLLAST